MTKNCIRNAILLRMYFAGSHSGEVVLLALLNVLIPFRSNQIGQTSPSGVKIGQTLPSKINKKYCDLN
jgi:hypothetical protein